MVQQPKLEIKKMKQGMSYSCKEKTIILNVFKYFSMQHPEKCVTEVVRRTAKATGCSEKSIFQFRKEEASGEGFKEPSKTKIRKNININSRDIKYDNTVREAIRNIVYDLRYKNVLPSLNNILKQINSNSQLPNFSLMTLRRLMFDMGFYYEKNGNKSTLVEKPRISNVTNNKPTNSKKLPQNQTVTNKEKYFQNDKKDTDQQQTSASGVETKSFSKKVDDLPSIQSHSQSLLQQNQARSSYMNETNGQRLLQVNVPQVENYTHIHPSSHDVCTIVGNKQELITSHPLSHNLEMSVKREVHPPWMYTHGDIGKQQTDVNIPFKAQLSPWMFPPSNSLVK